MDHPPAPSTPPSPSPSPEEEDLEPWPASLQSAFIAYLEKSTNRCVMTNARHATYKYHLKHPTAKRRGATPADRVKEASDKHQALKHFELRDNQLYRRPEVCRGKRLEARYAARIQDVFDIICRVHRERHYGIGKTHIRIHEQYYGITENDVRWVVEKCSVCKTRRASRIFGRESTEAQTEENAREAPAAKRRRLDSASSPDLGTEYPSSPKWTSDLPSMLHTLPSPESNGALDDLLQVVARDERPAAEGEQTPGSPSERTQAGQVAPQTTKDTIPPPAEPEARRGSVIQTASMPGRLTPKEHRPPKPRAVAISSSSQPLSLSQTPSKTTISMGIPPKAKSKVTISFKHPARPGEGEPLTSTFCIDLPLTNNKHANSAAALTIEVHVDAELDK